MSLRKKKKTQESEDEKWARMDKRIERERAKDELTRPVMGTIFLVVTLAQNSLAGKRLWLNIDSLL